MTRHPKPPGEPLGKMLSRTQGVEKCPFHDLRHTFTSNLLVEAVMELTGHKDIRSLKRYTHSHDEAKKAAIQKLGKRLQKADIDTLWKPHLV